jgi:clavulanate-9-aldehyde reductase
VPDGLGGKVVLVTGASSGIGRAIAVQLAQEGAQLVAGARRVDRLTELEKEIADAGGQVVPLELDVTDEGACRSAVQRTVDEFGRLDVLVNNAGVMLLGQIEGADTEDWRRMVNTNMLGVLYMTHAALPHLLERQGSVVQMSSTAGRVSRIGGGVYSATKFAVNAFSESLRQEVSGRGVRVIVVEPGMVATELREHITQPAAKEQVDKSASTIEQLQSEDIAAAVRYALLQPHHVSVNEVLIRPTDQAWG